MQQIGPAVRSNTVVKQSKAILGLSHQKLRFRCWNVALISGHVVTWKTNQLEWILRRAAKLPRKERPVANSTSWLSNECGGTREESTAICRMWASNWWDRRQHGAEPQKTKKCGKTTPMRLELQRSFLTVGYVRLWNSHQSKDANNGNAMNCKTEVKAQQECSALVERWVGNLSAPPALSCTACRFLIYWAKMTQTTQR